MRRPCDWPSKKKARAHWLETPELSQPLIPNVSAVNPRKADFLKKVLIYKMKALVVKALIDNLSTVASSLALNF